MSKRSRLAAANNVIAALIGDLATLAVLAVLGAMADAPLQAYVIPFMICLHVRHISTGYAAVALALLAAYKGDWLGMAVAGAIALRTMLKLRLQSQDDLPMAIIGLACSIVLIAQPAAMLVWQRPVNVIPAAGIVTLLSLRATHD